VVVIGAGLAGLACAYRLHQRGISAAVFEARPDRVGGRCWTAREFADGQIGEHGGEFIDTAHARIRKLARDLGLKLEDRDAYSARAPKSSGRRVFGGELVSGSEVYRGWGTFMRRLRATGDEVGYLQGRNGPAARAFDQRDALSYLEATVPGGAGSLLGEALQAYLASEFGLDAARLAATSVLYLLEGNAADEDGSDERFHVAGGNDQLTTGMADGLPSGSLTLDAPLEALWRNDDGSYGLRIANVGELTAELVVLALPFTTLREVELERAGLSPLKLEAIRELGMGTNSKVLLQFDRRPQHYGRWNGELTTDHPFEYSWDTSLTQPGRTGLVTAYSGGANGTAYDFAEAHGPAPDEVVAQTLAALERAVPGISAGFNGRAYLDEWATDPWARGSYATFLPGQTSRYAREIRRPEGGVHFAGEHTSIAFQGFLEGAVESGERAAREVAAAPLVGLAYRANPTRSQLVEKSAR
jgi:monoamine oxidase